jgi:glycosyltransferase involved in cell wall biosynthesis
VVIVERTRRPGAGVLAAAEDLVRRVRRDGACLVYALDDNLLDWAPRAIGQLGPSPEQLAVVRLLAREADGIIASTPALAARLAHLNPCIQVVANALDERLWAPPTPPAPIGAARPRLVIGFMGTHSHDADLRLILEPLRAVLRTQAGRLEFQLVAGVADPGLWRAFDGLPLRRLDEDRPVDYPAFMHWFTAHARWDIALGPLEATPFTRCKSDLKALDYAAIGAAGIYSRVTPYAESVRDGETGLLAENTVPAWRAALERLVADGELRSRLAANARQALLAGRTLSVCAGQWVDAIRAIAARPRRGSAA